MKVSNLKKLIENEKNLIIIMFLGKWNSQCFSTVSYYNSQCILYGCLFFKLNTEDPENEISYLIII